MSFSGREETCMRESLALIDDLKELTAIDAITARLFAGLSGFGFHAFLMTRLPARTERIDPYILLMTWPREWLRRYGRKRYYGHDPVAQTCFTTLRPFTWSDACWVGCDPDQARRVMGEAVDFGLVDGVMVPMHDLYGRQASLSLATRRLDLPPSGLKAIHLVSLYAFAATDELSGIYPRLTPREREVLTWLADGKGVRDVGQILAISDHTVAAHLKSAKAKLGGTTIAHAVALALRRREIRP